MSLSPDREIYSQSPITEAAIDIRCTNRPNFTIADVALLANSLSEEFRQEGEAIEKTEEVRADGARYITERPLGLVLRRYPDDRNVLQLQVEGFTWSHINRYERWETFRDDARRLWSHYAEAAQPQVVTRLGVRYINRLQIGDVIDDLTPFLRIYPVTPWKLEWPPAGFSLQVRVPGQTDEVLVINLATIRRIPTGEVAVLLDLETSREVDIPAGPDLWDLVERLHVTVEDAFESVITDRVRDLIR